MAIELSRDNDPCGWAQMTFGVPAAPRTSRLSLALPAPPQHSTMVATVMCTAAVPAKTFVGVQGEAGGAGGGRARPTRACPPAQTPPHPLPQSPPSPSGLRAACPSACSAGAG